MFAAALARVGRVGQRVARPSPPELRVLRPRDAGLSTAPRPGPSSAPAKIVRTKGSLPKVHSDDGPETGWLIERAQAGFRRADLSKWWWYVGAFNAAVVGWFLYSNREQHAGKFVRGEEGAAFTAVAAQELVARSRTHWPAEGVSRADVLRSYRLLRPSGLSEAAVVRACTALDPGATGRISRKMAMVLAAAAAESEDPAELAAAIWDAVDPRGMGILLKQDMAAGLSALPIEPSHATAVLALCFERDLPDGERTEKPSITVHEFVDRPELALMLRAGLQLGGFGPLLSSRQRAQAFVRVVAEAAFRYGEVAGYSAVQQPAAGGGAASGDATAPLGGNRWLEGRLARARRRAARDA